jgi:hypothetical protein
LEEEMRLSFQVVGWLALSTMLWASTASAQSVTITRNVNLRPEQSSSEPPIRLLTPSEPPLTLLEPHIQDGYYQVRTSAGEEGYVWARFVSVSAAPTPTAPATPTTPTTPATPTTPTTPTGTLGTTTIHLGPGVPGSANMVGCGDGRWHHVYNPTRLTVKQDCLTVTGTIVDATASQSTHQPDGVRHEGDGDTHGWLRVDPAFASLINAGNTSNEGGNLVFEIVCIFNVSQADAKASCPPSFHNKVQLPPLGSHVRIVGSHVQDTNHSRWMEVHPVTSITPSP